MHGGVKVPYGFAERISAAILQKQTREICPIAAGADFGFTENEV